MTTLIFETRVGSRAYGLQHSKSDHDYKGIIVGPKHWYFSFRKSPEQLELNADHVQFEVRKFIKLAQSANPTALEMLWTEPEDHAAQTSAGELLLNAREGFLSKKVRGSFGEYAESQLKRIRLHRSWLLNPPQKKPSRKDFGLPESTLIPKDQLGAAEALIAAGKIEEADVSDNFIDCLHREKSYRTASQQWKQYQSWKKERNPARAMLEKEYGYDTKHAMHLVRLQRMGIEVLESSKIIVRRADREELIAIRNGHLSYDELIDLCKTQRARLDRANSTTKLPNECDPDWADQLCVSIIERVLEGNSK